MCHAVSVVSGLYPGVSPATHSPQPVTPSTLASTSTMRRSSVRVVLVSNGATSFILTSRNVISRIRILNVLPQRPLEIAPWRQQIRLPLLPCAYANRRVLPREPFGELLAHPFLQRVYPRSIILLPLLEFRRQLDSRGSIGRVRRQALYRG